jgi:hypothetical protein
MHEILTPIQAIRKKCLECSNGQYVEIKGCLIETCPLYTFRTGIIQSKKEKNTFEQMVLDCINDEF